MHKPVLLNIKQLKQLTILSQDSSNSTNTLGLQVGCSPTIVTPTHTGIFVNNGDCHSRNITPVPMWRVCSFPFWWESHGTRGNSHELLTSYTGRRHRTIAVLTTRNVLVAMCYRRRENEHHLLSYTDKAAVINKAIVDIRLRPRCAIPHYRPIIDSSNACNQASAPIMCTPLHGPVQFAIHRDVMLVGHMFPPKLPLPLWGSSAHVTHFSSGQAHSSSQTASRSV